jgi:hypothetical protein
MKLKLSYALGVTRSPNLDNVVIHDAIYYAEHTNANAGHWQNSFGLIITSHPKAPPCLEAAYTSKDSMTVLLNHKPYAMVSVLDEQEVASSALNKRWKIVRDGSYEKGTHPNHECRFIATEDLEEDQSFNNLGSLVCGMRDLPDIRAVAEHIVALHNQSLVTLTEQQGEPTEREAALELARMVVQCEDDYGSSVPSTTWKNIVAQADAFKLRYEGAKTVEGPTLDRLLETVADIAFLAGLRTYHSGDSRADVQQFIAWANEFEKLRTITDGVESYGGENYMIAIEKFAYDKIKQSGHAKEPKAHPFEQLCNNVLEQLAVRNIDSARLAPGCIIIRSKVESLSERNRLEWMFNNEEDVWAGHLMLDGDVLVTLRSEVDDDCEEEAEIAEFIAEVVTHADGKVTC